MSVSLTSGVAVPGQVATSPAGSKVPYVLSQSAVPVCLAPNGTVAANGVVTLGTALPVTYSGGIWLRLPAGAINGGAAGLYWAVMSSTTVGQVYTNFADPATGDFVPYIPGGALTPAVGSNVAYTQTTGSDVSLYATTIPANAMGPNGTMRLFADRRHPNNANNKVFKVKSGAVTINSTTNTTSAADARPTFLHNAGSASLNLASGFMGLSQGGSTDPLVRTTIDTSVAQSIPLTGQLVVATDYLVIESVILEIVPS